MPAQEDGRDVEGVDAENVVPSAAAVPLAGKESRRGLFSAVVDDSFQASEALVPRCTLERSASLVEVGSLGAAVPSVFCRLLFEARAPREMRCRAREPAFQA